mmetsp:Transcript_13518/g.17619  ORF Transcript_13518/g.17619 Transcript_13518/m.17619 type:complete len:328 (-) Transcript_13518:257-1240(-)
MDSPLKKINMDKSLVSEDFSHEKLYERRTRTRSDSVVDGCSALILSSDTGGRLALFEKLSHIPGAEVSFDGSSENEVDMLQAFLDEIGSVEIQTFECRKNSKNSRVLLSVLEPDVIFYVVPLSISSNQKDAENEIAQVFKSLVKASAHLPFVLNELASTARVQVCLVFTDCERFRQLISAKVTSEEVKRMQKLFKVKDASPEAIMLGIVREFESILEQQRPQKIRALLLEQVLRKTGKAIPSSSTSRLHSSFDVDDDFAIARQVLGLLQSVKQDKEISVQSEGLMIKNGDQLTQNLATVLLAGVIMVMFAYIVGTSRQSQHVKHSGA